MVYKTLAVVMACWYPLNLYTAFVGFSTAQNIATQARACAYYIAYNAEDDPDYQTTVTLFLHHVQSLNSDGLTLLHSPKDFNFYTNENDLKAIDSALYRAIGGDDKFFEALFYQQSNNGDTPIHYAIRCGNQPWLCVLLKVALSCSKSCDLALVEGLLLIKNKDDETVFDCALRGKRYYAQKQYGPLYHDMFKMLKKFKRLLLKKSKDLY